MCIRDRIDAFQNTVGRPAAALTAIQVGNAERHEHRGGPVSYTHLDVYKRQAAELKGEKK